MIDCRHAWIPTDGEGMGVEAGLYVPISTAQRDLNVFVRTAGYYSREEEVILLLTSRT